MDVAKYEVSEMGHFKHLMQTFAKDNIAGVTVPINETGLAPLAKAEISPSFRLM